MLDDRHICAKPGCYKPGTRSSMVSGEDKTFYCGAHFNASGKPVVKSSAATAQSYIAEMRLKLGAYSAQAEREAKAEREAIQAESGYV